MNRKIQIVNLLFLIFVACRGNPTSPSLEVREHILPGYFVTAMARDSKGTLWLGTFRQGLVKYDGKATVYNSKNSPLPDSLHVQDIAIDHNDEIWFSASIGLIHFDRKNFTIFNTTNSPLTYDKIRSIAIDKNNVIWMAAPNINLGCLATFDGKNWQVFTPENSMLPAKVIRDIVIDNRNNVWAAMNGTVTSTCLLKISGNAWKIYDQTEIGFTPYYWGNLAVDSHDNLYASIDYMLSSLYDTSRPGLVKFDGQKWTVRTPLNEYGESLGYVNSVDVDWSGNIWTSVMGEGHIILAIFDGEHWIRHPVKMELAGRTPIIFDGSNYAWVGTANGVYVFER